MTGGIVNGVEQRRRHRDHHDFRYAFGPFVLIHWRQNLNLKIVKRQVRPACDDVLPEVPCPVAGSVLVMRQRLEQRIANAHCEAALRLSDRATGALRIAKAYSAWPHSSTLYAFAIRNAPVARSISMRITC